MVERNVSRINVVGTSGSGKSTFASKLAGKLDLPLIEQDVLYWGPNWTAPSDAVYFEKLKAVTSSDRWILDGNYSRTIPLKWERVQLVIWLDYSFVRTLYQVIKRSLFRAWDGKEIWKGSGCKESFRKTFFSSDSVILWAVRTFRRHRKSYWKFMQDENYSHVEFVRLRNPKESKRFLENL